MILSDISPETPAAPEPSAALWRRLVLGWMDGIEAGWAIPLLLLGFVAVWLTFTVVAFLVGDLHPDVLEAWSYGRQLDWGYPKHPPLAAWIAHAWGSVFPLTNWSFQLLALTNSAIALWAVDLISRRFVQGDKRMVVLLLLMLLPIYQFLAQPFGSGAVLLAAWPIATYCFLRSFETRQFGWAVAAGATAALAMLAKYNSAFLIASFVIAAICHPRRRAYLASVAPWVSTLAGFAVLAPHLRWLATSGTKPFAEALGQLAANASAPSLIETFLFMLILALVLAIPVLVWSLISTERFRKLSHDFAAMNPGLLLLYFVSIGTIVLPTIAAVVLGIDMTAVWGVQGLFLFAILIVCSADYPVERIRAVNLAALVTGIAVLFVAVVAPVHAYYRNFHPFDQGRNFYQLSAVELTRQWHEQSDTPLPAVGGDQSLALAAAFYGPDHPVVEDQLGQRDAEAPPTEMALARGWASLCLDGDVVCIDSMERGTAGATRVVRSEFVVRSNLAGLGGQRQRFMALIVPPSSAPPAVAAPPDVAESSTTTVPPSETASPAATASAAVAALPETPPPSATTAPPAMASPPSVAAGDETFGPPPGPDIAQGSPANPAERSQQEMSPPTCCVAGRATDPAGGGSEVGSPPAAVPVDGRDRKLSRAPSPPSSAYRADAAAEAEFHLNWVRWAAMRRAAGGCPVGSVAGGWRNPCCSSCWSAARAVVARWQASSASPGCTARRNRHGCSAARRGPGSVASRGSGADTSFSFCSSGAGASAPRPLLARLAQPLCALAAVFDVRSRGSHRNQQVNAPLPRARATIARQEPLRGGQGAGVAEAAGAAGEYGLASYSAAND